MWVERDSARGPTCGPKVTAVVTAKVMPEAVSSSQSQRKSMLAACWDIELASRWTLLASVGIMLESLLWQLASCCQLLCLSCHLELSSRVAPVPYSDHHEEEELLKAGNNLLT